VTEPATPAQPAGGGVQVEAASAGPVFGPRAALDRGLGTLRRMVRSNYQAFRMASLGLAVLRGSRALMRRRRGARDHLLSTASLVVKSTRIFGRPMNVTIEPTNVCNLECPVCETGAGILGRPSGHMSPEQFRTIIDKLAPHTNTLMFYFMGEPFINKNSYEMIRYAKDAGIPWVETCTNGDPVHPDKLVDCGIDEVSFQIGGMTQETHQIYRINSNLERVLRHLEETLRRKRERRPAMQVNSGFILMKHNEHEVAEFRRRMAEMGVDRAVVIDPCVRTVEQGQAMLPTDKAHWYYDPDAFAKGVLRPRVLPDNDCPWIYYSMTIHVNGDVVPCCRDPRGLEVVGNVLRQEIEEIWNGERFRAFRARLHRDQGAIEICRLCSAYGVSAIR
jgi:radical SAM protein with 4Fe4S-binding SPASM domain